MVFFDYYAPDIARLEVETGNHDLVVRIGDQGVLLSGKQAKRLGKALRKAAKKIDS